MGTGVEVWSQTAASNANVDSSINWAEGMAPSAVNDSARATMASIAKWRDDISGSILTTGTSTAYAVTSSQGISLTAGNVVAFSPHTTNGATVTLSVDGSAAKPLRSAPGVELLAGFIVQGTPYVALFASSNGGEWILANNYGNVSGFNVPIGGLMPYLGSTAPNSSFVLPFGQAISRTGFAALFAIASTTFGSGDGSTTFNVPDLRGRAVFGLDNMGGTAASRITSAGGNFNGTTRGATGGSQNHTLTTAEAPSGLMSLNDPGHAHSYNVPAPGQTSGGGLGNAGSVTAGETTGSSSTGISLNDNGGNAAHTIMPPAMTIPYILRVI